MTEQALKIFGQNLLNRAVERKHRLGLDSDTIAETLEEIADAIPETIRDLKKLGYIEPPAFNPGHCGLSKNGE